MPTKQDKLQKLIAVIKRSNFDPLKKKRLIAEAKRHNMKGKL